MRSTSENSKRKAGKMTEKLREVIVKAAQNLARWNEIELSNKLMLAMQEDMPLKDLPPCDQPPTAAELQLRDQFAMAALPAMLHIVGTSLAVNAAFDIADQCLERAKGAGE
jgi:hypothetical protein